MERSQFLQVALPEREEMYFHLASIGFAFPANYEAVFHAARQEGDDAMVLQLQSFRQFADRGPVPARKTAYVQQEQVLQRSDAFGLGRSLAEVEKTAQLVTEFGEGFVLLLV